MALFLFFAAIVVLAAASPAIGQLPGFLSIDCGLEAKYSGYKDTDLGIVYVSDGPYIDNGENHQASGDSTTRRPYLTLRRFPTGERNCYALPTVSGDKYLVRVVIARDSQNSSSTATTTATLQFDLHLGANYWDTVHDDGTEVYEALFMAWASWAPVCLVNTGQGSPYASAIELRPLGSEIYPAVMANQSLRLSSRQRMGQINSSVTRFPDDQYDRFWWTMPTNPMWANLSTTSNIQEESTMFGVPSAILQKAVTVAGNGTMLNIMSEDRSFFEFMVFLHLADFQDNKIRQFNVYFNSDNPLPYIPQYLAADYVYSRNWYSSTDGKFNITLAATAKSLLPPMLNALEIYTLVAHSTPTTFSKDFDAIMAIKFEYGIKKNWMGDPCSPSRFAWDGVICRNTSDNIPRIISLDLSNSNLHGVISNNFTLLTALENLNLTGNQLNGTIPGSLCKLNAGSFIFSYNSDQDVCKKTSPSSSRSRATILAISIAAPVMVVAILGLSYLIWRVKRKSNKFQNPQMLQEMKNIIGIIYKKMRIVNSPMRNWRRLLITSN
ncbi:hypothetical protein DAI22_09g069700 [Oryza sativa Japonica Group]|nr:hypothetical protein DAI22_09g069700 [Oryza sativa Japonica Group]